MRTIHRLALTACLALAAASPLTAHAATTPKPKGGAVKGAVVGAAAGHMMGHHTKTGAVAGAAIGHHERVKSKRNIANGGSG